MKKNVEEVLQLEFSREFCQKIITVHDPRNDVVYQAGIGAEGEAVVPADLNAFHVPIPKKIIIPISIHKKYSLKTNSSGTVTIPDGKVIISEGIINLPEEKITIPEGTVTLPQGQVTQSGTSSFLPKGIIKSPYVDEIPLGFVEYELESGKMTYNGKAFSSQQEALLRQKCQDVLEKSEN